MEKIVKPGLFNEYQRIAFYHDKNVISVDNFERGSIEIPEGWEKEIKGYTYEANSFRDPKGIVFDSENFQVRNARKVNLAKNDLFTVKEYDESARENKRALYIPAEIEPAGKVKQCESKFGYHLYKKTKVNCPIKVTVWLREVVSKEKADECFKQWNGKRYEEKPGVAHEVKHRQSFDGTQDDYIIVHYIDIIVPWFYLLTFSEVVHSEYYELTDKLADKMNEVLKSRVLSHYDIDRLLEHFDIIEKKEG